MPSQAGYYKWDDASLTPGQKVGGGWSQNLYDEDGFLREHARFIPDDSLDLDDDVPSASYIPTDQRSESGDSFELAIAAAVATLAATGAIHAAPHVKRWWGQTAQPFVMVQAEKIAGLFRRHTETGDDAVDPTHGLVRPNLELPAPEHRAAMSSAEVQARLLAAMAAYTYGQQQLRLVTQARIVDADELDDVHRQLATIPQEQLTAILEQMVRDPALLQDASLANLASLLGQTQLSSIA
ncbi:hypothetical protein [Actinomyces sp. zg296]|uniref:hypothetical protein n=1 Tax=Actinomyces sp. zg296 TaxID=2609289 RepID=UPI0013569DA9|nr:hypothetical protein [Actinomyces sp. zg296]